MLISFYFQKLQLPVCITFIQTCSHSKDEQSCRKPYTPYVHSNWPCRHNGGWWSPGSSCWSVHGCWSGLWASAAWSGRLLRPLRAWWHTHRPRCSWCQEDSGKNILSMVFFVFHVRKTISLLFEVSLASWLYGYVIMYLGVKLQVEWIDSLQINQWRQLLWVAALIWKNITGWWLRASVVKKCKPCELRHIIVRSTSATANYINQTISQFRIFYINTRRISTFGSKGSKRDALKKSNCSAALAQPLSNITLTLCSIGSIISRADQLPLRLHSGTSVCDSENTHLCHWIN